MKLSSKWKWSDRAWGGEPVNTTSAFVSFVVVLRFESKTEHIEVPVSVFQRQGEVWDTGLKERSLGCGRIVRNILWAGPMKSPK